MNLKVILSLIISMLLSVSLNVNAGVISKPSEPVTTDCNDPAECGGRPAEPQ